MVLVDHSSPAVDLVYRTRRTSRPRFADVGARERAFRNFAGNWDEALARWKLRIWSRRSQIRFGRHIGEANYCAIYVDALSSICRAAGTCQQVRPWISQVEHNVLVDLACIQSSGHRVIGLLAQLCVPERAVCLRMARVGFAGEIAKDIQQIAAIAQGVDQRDIVG